MKKIEPLLKEFEHETRTTRRHLERLPDDKLGWRLHEKSFTAGMLASHLVDCVRWVDSIFSLDELDMDPATYKPYCAASTADLLQTFDSDVARCKQVLAGVADETMARPWRLKMRGRLIWEKDRDAVFRDFTLHHLIHHRGQFSVYLRLMDVSVPGSYGPSADETF